MVPVSRHPHVLAGAVGLLVGIAFHTVGDRRRWPDPVLRGSPDRAPAAKDTAVLGSR